VDARARRVRLGLGVALALVAWGALVSLAIRAGRELRGDDGSVLLLAAWSLGAIACLYAALALLLRLRHAPPPRLRGGRHAGPRR
jgi:hypothetical protein